MNTEPAEAGRLLVVDGGAGYDVMLDAGAVEIRRYDVCAQRVPIRRIGRVILRSPRERGLRALLELVERGAAVHFQDGHGRIAAALVPVDLEPSAPVRDLLAAIGTQRDPRSRYCEWLELQLRHGASLILRTTPRGSVAHFERQLEDYAARGIAQRRFAETWNELQALLHAWVDAELTRRRMRAVVDALGWRGCPLLHDLDRVLSIALVWKLAPWLRDHPEHPARQRMVFFEHVRPQLEKHLDTAIIALDYHLRQRASRARCLSKRRAEAE